jgi:TnpA family transposase
MLSFANRRHITVEKLEAARRELVEFYLTLDLPKVWGKGTVVGADGTQFDFYENNMLAGYHFRYRKMGASATGTWPTIILPCLGTSCRPVYGRVSM